MRKRLQRLGFGTMLVSVLAAQTSPPAANHGSQPHVSPDGKWVAFTGDREGKPGLLIIPSDVGTERWLAAGARPAGWSTDSRQAYYSVWSADKNVSELRSVGVDGSGDRLIGNCPGRGPSISPDGKWVAYPAGQFPNVRLAIQRLDGSGTRELTDPATPSFNYAWAPDGQQIAFTRLEADKMTAVWVASVDGNGVRRVVRSEDVRLQVPAWTKDGKKLAMQGGATTRGLAHVYIADADGTNLRQIAPHTGYLDESVSWFPDGARLAIQSNRTGAMEVWVMSADGSGARQLTR